MALTLTLDRTWVLVLDASVSLPLDVLTDPDVAVGVVLQPAGVEEVERLPQHRRTDEFADTDDRLN